LGEVFFRSGVLGGLGPEAPSLCGEVTPVPLDLGIAPRRAGQARARHADRAMGRIDGGKGGSI
jgi:hypothetical protein